MLLKFERNVTMKRSQNYVLTKYQMTMEITRSVTMKNLQQQNMRNILKTTTKTHRKKRIIRERKYNKLIRTIANYIAPLIRQSSSKLTASTPLTSSTTATSSETEFGKASPSSSSLALPSSAATSAALALLSTSSTTSTTSLSSLLKTKTIKHKWPPRQKSTPTVRKWLSMPILLLLLLVQSQNVINALEQSEKIGHSAKTKATTIDTTLTKFSQPFETEANNEYSFRPIIPKDINLEYISQNVFTKTGQYRVFESMESDLRVTAAVATKEDKKNNNTPLAIAQRNQEVEKPTTKSEMKTKDEASKISVDYSATYELPTTKNSANNSKMENVAAKSKQISYDESEVSKPTQQSKPEEQATNMKATSSAITTPTVDGFSGGVGDAGDFQMALKSEIKGLEGLLAEYVDNFFNKGQYQPKPELITALQQNYTDMKQQYDQNVLPKMPVVLKKARPTRQVITERSNDELSMNIPRAFESGRLLFFAGLKKVMWPIYMGLQILKSLMFALLLPTLIGSFGKLLGKGLTSGSAPLFIRPMDEPQDLDFKDNNLNFDEDGNKFNLMDVGSTAGGGTVKDNGYAYNQAEASQTHNQYAYNAADINQQAFSRYGMNERQQMLMQDSYLSAIQSLGAASFKNSIGLSGSSTGGGIGGGLAAPMRQKPASPANMNTFQQFQKVPASSLLLSNYDPFYSPLLSRLDSVFAQLKLHSDDEACREKLICLMYANPAKYAPYSNLVSAQLSRELNELRKPTSDNPDILRFFKYMRAAKDGQDGIDCEVSFDKCKEFKDFENPAMVSTYHDINKLVQARKLT